MSQLLRQGRGPLEPRSLQVSRGVSAYAEGSALVKLGKTEVLATVSLDQKAAPHMRGKKEGWLMAEYLMLPRATHDRQNRERNMQTGRRHEIQRLLGRSFRSAMNLSQFRNQTLVVDCDVLQADGGTRVTSVLAGYAALFDLCDKMIHRGTLSEWPLKHELGAVSVGYVRGQLLVDLEYAEDVHASADLNVVATSSGLVLEVQGGAEDAPITPEHYIELLRLGIAAAGDLTRQLHAQL